MKIPLFIGLIVLHTLVITDGRILDKKLSKNHNIQKQVVISNALITEGQEDLDYKKMDEEKQKLSTAEGQQSQNVGNCSLSNSLIEEIQSYKYISELILTTLTQGAFKGKTYKELQTFVDQFGTRVTGSATLEKSIDYMMEFMRNQDLNVTAEEADVPNWIRGTEKAYMLVPNRKEIALDGLGYTVGTPPDGITAEVLVVKSFDDLRANASKAKGKIIVFNEEYISYGESVQYRGVGAVEAAKVGGLAALIRSITPFSLYTPHTGMMYYEANVTEIPAACITVEDAELLYRLQEMGQKIIIQLQMNDVSLPVVKSRNAIGEIQGYDKPDEVVVVSGHIDSWDVGQGALDDGGGMFISVQALALLQSLDLKPRRTLRAILWTAEEFGLVGVQQYVKDHQNELEKFKAVFESDFGTFKPLGLDFTGTDEAACIVQEVMKLLAPINATMLRKMDTVGSDISYFLQQNVPGLSLNNENEKYFYYHHTEADTMTVLDSNNLDLCVAVWATASYVLADLSVELPR